jgi:hypothetical protein
MVEIGAAPLVSVLGFSGVDRIRYDGRFAVATIPGDEPLTLVVSLWGEPLDALWRPAVVESQTRGPAWSLLFNGMCVRMVDVRRVFSRRYAEQDLDLAADDPGAAAALWTVFGAGAFRKARDEASCSIVELVAASDRHGAEVCRGLRDGVLQASQGVLAALARRSRHTLPDTFDQALTIVYRVLFLLFSEARALVPMWHPIYRHSYSVESLRESAESSPAPYGLWDALRAVSRIAHEGCRAGDLQVTAFNGRLFAPARAPLAEQRHLDNHALRDAVLALATQPAADGAGRERVAYGDLGVEQLGAVYETLLDYEPAIDRHRVATLVRGSGRRKSTGTFYTPQPLAQYLIRRTLTPLVADAPPDRILDLKVLDPAMGSGAMLVAACEFLASAYEAALVRTGGCHASDIGPSEQASIRRRIAERCLFGVDVNPMAVQLARLSLWLSTLAADRPLTFLDHHLQAGDSLIGAWLANLRRPPARHRTGRGSTLPLFETPAFGDALRETLPARFALASTAADTVSEVREKERMLAALGAREAALTRWKRIADLWCAAWFQKDRALSSAFSSLSDAILTGASALPDSLLAPLLQRSEQSASKRRFFHWELEFPEAFFDAQGARLAASGFDAVIGNPPWDMIRADPGGTGAPKGAPYERKGPPDGDQRALREPAAVVRFTRDSGTYVAQSDGHANCYQLFLERAIHLARNGGRIGLVLPSGVTADHGSAKLRRLLFSRCGVDSIVGFDNRAGVFPIHRSARFVLVTATNGQPTSEIACRLGERNAAALESGNAEAWFSVRVTPAVLERLTGDDLALPELTSARDLAIAERAAVRFPPLSDPRGWGARFGRELNATDDRPLLDEGGRGLPVVEGKQISPFRVDLAASRCSIARRHADRLLGTRHHRWRLGYRDVASSTNKVTLIATLIPPGAVTTHTIFCLRSPLGRRDQLYLCGLFNSLVINYLVRLRVVTHVTTAIVERLPIPTMAHDWEAARQIARLAAALSRRRVAVSRSREAAAELNAVVAGLYELTDEEFVHILGTFPLVPEDERDLALREFQKRRGPSA